MSKYVLINFEFLGKVDWETPESISVNKGDRWAKYRNTIQRLNYFEYLSLKFAKWVIEKITKWDV